MVISGGAGAAPTDPMKAWRSGLEKNCWKCSTLSHSPWIRHRPGGRIIDVTAVSSVTSAGADAA
jgi:hypothetical protein